MRSTSWRRSRPAKEIMLDAKSVLFVCLKTPIDFRKISVARLIRRPNLPVRPFSHRGGPAENRRGC